MLDVKDPSAWVTVAEEDFQIAQLALRRREPFTRTACFHAQQCAEKYLKGLLVARGSKFPKVHDLLTLNRQCERAGILVAVDPTQLDKLSFYAVDSRYPAAVPALADAREAIETAQAVRKFARRFLGIKGRL